VLSTVWENRYGRLALLCGASLALAQLQLFFFLFVVPLHLLYRVQGRRSFFLGALLTTAALAGQMLVDLSALEEQELFRLFMLVQASVPVMLLTGVYMMLDRETFRFNGIYRFLLALLVVGIIGFLVFPRVFNNETLARLIQSQWEQMGRLFTAGNRVEGGMEDALIQEFFRSPELWTEMTDLFLRTWLVGFAGIILFCWRLGERFWYTLRLRSALTRGEEITALKPPGLLTGFRVPQSLLWPFLLAWAVILVLHLFPVPLLRYPFWNIGLVLLFLYGLQGMGLIQYLANRRGLPRAMRFFGLMLIMALFMRPGWNSIVIIGIPAFGLSEYWVHYRKQR